MDKIRSLACVLLAGFFLPLAAFGSTLSGYHSFNNQGNYPDYSPVIQVGGAPFLYGTLYGGGTSGYGTVYRLNLANANLETTLHNFSGGTDGAYPYGGMVAVGRYLYGNTYSGGANNGGIAFKLLISGTNYTVLHSFAGGSDGANPGAAPIYCACNGGIFYGTTIGGGTHGWGTIYKMDKLGNVTILHSFANTLDGGQPWGSLIRIGSRLYGTTNRGGAPGQGSGTVYRINTSGSGFTVLHTFGASGDGGEPAGALIYFASALWGTTSAGGTSGRGTVFKINLNGTGYSSLYSFAGGNLDGRGPWSTLLPVSTNPSSPAALYGTTSGGGPSDNGTVFKITALGAETMLNSFTGGSDGANPGAGMINVNGILYGTANYGGGFGRGTIFQFTP